MRQFLLLCSLCLLGCGDSSPSTGVLAPRLQAGEASPIWLWPARPEAGFSESLRVHLLGAAPERIETLQFRAGDRQWNELRADVATGSAGLTLHCTAAGDAVVAASELGGRRFAKALFAVRDAGGSLPAPSAAASKRIGQAFEIVPMLDPRTLGAGDQLPLRLRCDPGPLPPCTVVAFWRSGGGEPQEAQRATPSADGSVVLTLAAAGDWFVLAAAGDQQATLAFTSGGGR
jgi:hypothetical protein